MLGVRFHPCKCLYNQAREGSHSYRKTSAREFSSVNGYFNYFLPRGNQLALNCSYFSVLSVDLNTTIRVHTFRHDKSSFPRSRCRSSAFPTSQIQWNLSSSGISHGDSETSPTIQPSETENQIRVRRSEESSQSRELFSLGVNL